MLSKNPEGLEGSINSPEPTPITLLVPHSRLTVWAARLSFCRWAARHASRFMNTPDQIKIFLSMFLQQLPTLIVCLVACIIILTKRGAASRGSSWALLGFGSVLFLCIVMPVVQTILQSWIFQSGQRADRMWALTTVWIVGPVLDAATYVFLLLAVLAGRTTTDSTNRPPLSPK